MTPDAQGAQTGGRIVLEGTAHGRIVATAEALSFWGGVDPATGRVIDAHHPLAGVSLSGAILMMPTSRGSCSGSGVLLDMLLTGRAPAALVFCEGEEVLTLGALVAAAMFDRPMAVLRLAAADFDRLSRAETATIQTDRIEAGAVTVFLAPVARDRLRLTSRDQAQRAGQHGEAVAQAMAIVCAMAALQDATQLIDVTQVHIDGCIYASAANLTFAQRMADMGARVVVPTTTNAISVDRANWRAQGTPDRFGAPAATLADAYVQMGCAPSFTCAPYLLATAPRLGECIAWAESNAVIFANTVIGARTAKHPDFLDLCIALTGRAPLAGPYLDDNRKARRVVDVDWPEGADDAIWPLLGYLAGQASPDRIPLLCGLEEARPSRDDLKALCAAFGTTSGAPMLHIRGVTPEAEHSVAPDADAVRLTEADMAAAWTALNNGPPEIDLVAFGSPHASGDECRAIADAFGGRRCRDTVAVIVTVGQDVLGRLREDGLLQRLRTSGVQVVADLCWCSISEPVFPSAARTVMTNSGKYAHYGPGLSGRVVRFGALQDCVKAALEGAVQPRGLGWASGET